MKKDKRLTYFEMKRKLSLLQELSKYNAEFEEYVPILKSMVNKVKCLAAVPITNDYLYRGRINLNGKLFNNISEISYPQKDMVKDKGRLNNIGESMLYASNGELGTLVEMDLNIYHFFTISKIRLMKKGIYIVPIGIPWEIYSLIPIIPQTRAEEILLDYCKAEITKKVSNSTEYNSTIALAHLFLDWPVLNCREGRFGGILYPSAKVPFKSNKQTYNYAIVPKIFDSCFAFEEIYTYYITREKKSQKIIESYLQMNAVNKVNIINNDGSLDWLFDFNEMKDRVLKGQDLFGYTCENLKGMEKYL